jgi:hypothetical protein
MLGIAPEQHFPSLLGTICNEDSLAGNAVSTAFQQAIVLYSSKFTFMIE